MPCRLDEFLPQDFILFNASVSDDPASLLRNNTIVARHTPEGRITIDNDTFREWRGGEVVAERHIGGQQELLSLLEERFGISLPSSVQ